VPFVESTSCSHVTVSLCLTVQERSFCVSAVPCDNSSVNSIYSTLVCCSRLVMCSVWKDAETYNRIFFAAEANYVHLHKRVKWCIYYDYVEQRIDTYVQELA